MLDNGALALSATLREIIASSLARLHPFPAYRLPRKRKSSGVKEHRWPHTASRTYFGQGDREKDRRLRQMYNSQLDFTASGQPLIMGRKRLIREMYLSNRKAV